MNRKIAVAVFTMAALASTGAKAEMLYLKCGTFNSSRPMAIDLDKSTLDGRPVTITPIAIDLHNVNNVGDVHIHIDRTTGVLTEGGVYYNPPSNIPESTYSCTSVSAPATKF